MEKYINDYGKECYRNVTEDSPFSPELFHFVKPRSFGDTDIQYALHTNLGSITVLDRLTGYGYTEYGYFIRDTETGYRDMDGKFWLASGMIDVRRSDCKTIGEAISYIKTHANNCIGI